MANEIYSSSWWGVGVCDNTIDWGISYKDLAGCTPAFSNTYSLAFDGVDDFISFSPFSLSAEFTLSAWVKPVSLSANQGNIISAATNNANKLGISSSSSVQVKLGGIISTITDAGSNNFSIGVWQHILIIRDSSNIVTVFRNGSAFGSPSTANAGTGTYDSIGKFNNSQFLDEQLDEVAYWTSDQTSNISAIYNSGVPNNLNDLTTPPTAWYRMGENGSYKSPQWLLPENSNKDKVSNFSFNFDGVDDKITFSSITTSGAFTVSFWAKPTAFNVNGSSFIFGTESGNSNFFKLISATSVQFKIVDSSGTTNTFNDTTGSNDVVLDAWQNFIATRDASGNFKLYRNGVQFGSTLTNANTITINSIGRVIASSIGYAGNVNNFVYWDSVQDVAPIYNSGTPTTITGAVTHYKMGEDATFSTNWTVPDAVGSADGTSANMTIEDRVGEAPNSTSNALSYNMTESDRETDVPS